MIEITDKGAEKVHEYLSAQEADISLADVTPVFHRWIQDHVCEEALIDVAPEEVASALRAVAKSRLETAP